MSIELEQLFGELDFEAVEPLSGSRPAFRFHCGPNEFEIIPIVNRWLQQAYLVVGTVATARTASMVEVELPLEVGTREEGLALLGHFIGGAVAEVDKPPWLRIAERLSAHLPWCQQKRIPTLFAPSTQ